MAKRSFCDCDKLAFVLSVKRYKLIVFAHNNFFNHYPLNVHSYGLNLTGILRKSSRCGSPDGLSFFKISVPVFPFDGLINVNSAVNGTKFSVIQSSCACAIPRAIILPVPSVSSIGKLASKYQGPRALPVIFKGEEIIVFGLGS